MNLACPACGFRTVSENTYGTYNICPICGWEDDGVQLANPACGGGANGESLIEAQSAALAANPLSQREADGYDRDPLWRPLNEAEIMVARAERDQGIWKNGAILRPSDVYWRAA
jgi:hypothetical protein